MTDLQRHGRETAQASAPIPEWTKESAARIEALLISVIQRLQSVIGADGCSFHRVKDFKINFKHIASFNQNHSYFLEYDPNTNTASAWPSGLSYRFPADVVEHISATFPQAKHSSPEGKFSKDCNVVDGFHHWKGISLDDLQSAAVGGKPVEEQE